MKTVLFRDIKLAKVHLIPISSPSTFVSLLKYGFLGSEKNIEVGSSAHVIQDTQTTSTLNTHCGQLLDGLSWSFGTVSGGGYTNAFLAIRMKIPSYNH